MKKGMPFSKEQISMANRVNLIDFAKSHGYILENGGRRAYHVKQNGGLYFFKDSNKYYHFSTDTSGGSIDFVMQFLDMDFKEAVAYLLETESPHYQPSAKLVKDRGQLTLPEKAPNFRRVAWYLIQVRGIDPEIISCLMHEKKLYQDKSGNCVLIGYDTEGTPKYCSLRGTRLKRPFKQDRPYSDKSNPFHIVGNSHKVYVFESPIDAMSHATLAKLAGQDWKIDHRISLGCLSDQALKRFLHYYPNITEIVFCLDNDKDATFQNGNPAPNWGQEAALKFATIYASQGYVTSVETPLGKDLNEDLCARRLIIEERTWSAEEDMVER